MSLYEKYFLPKLLDFCCGMEGFQNKRSQIVPLAHGRILEIGIGSGLNFDHYNFDKVEEIIGVDPAVSSVAMARSRSSQYNSKISFIESSAESIDLPSNTFDCVVIGYSLCTIPDPLKALAEARRLMKPEGSLFFMEHGLAPEQNIQKWQHRLTPGWKKIGGGCNLNRDIEALIKAGGFQFKSLSKKYIKGPKIAAFQYYGEAVKS
ncbi:class I SAM-dependent methyltransferase [Gammaproteobacteria bacterium]|jgi:ubiquinone/menaquinone biosynthesis C-methylase UbiE|nr:class I SAM-dependent methyltransferase [Gammaproteobacteria bacterium]MDB9901137.1 class I SAM-dependent methyltransferase [Gammaproteobacteria bacterium]MDC0123031.1 class I SAM-dependent methyltransferase [Gammaproteobacteria bacterium]MDC1415461.1 class I SAM-dependent methyltransferase [Gammaproteobacteria bacterium]MDC1469518.1 class I SAM-dependent methyltransferase [Gammaproteobacteria bacterium]